ncbi:hypothetical protein Ahy_A04g019048 [Arachis hypogaea]|uniref:Uncharacterized protein n=1 Tax=Arachis hypogaea TaxID=3818 RepID=A0A445DF93_ARAHY|nr:hypothetical protein Ahy_A04g019048 [Arachis hypogaea]
MPPPMIDTVPPESSHESQPDTFSLPPIKKFLWGKTYDLMIKNIFYHRMARQLQQMLEDVHIKKLQYIHWKTDEGFKHRCLTNRANRASGRSSKYTGGSATFMKTKARITLKDNKKRFADQQAADHYDSYTKRLEATTQQSQHIGDNRNNSTEPAVDLDRVWCEAASEPYKNRMYRLGSFFIDNLPISTLRHSSASATSRPVDPEDVDLQKQVLFLTRNLHQQA